MAPKARNPLRGPGRKAAAAEATPDATPAKRGRPAAKADTVEIAVEPPKKRGRPAKAKAEESEAATQDAPQPKKRGRPSMHAEEEAAPDKGKGKGKGNGKAKKEVATTEAAEEAIAPRKRGRPRKEEAAADAPVTPKRGRPAKTAALDLHRVTGSTRVGKRTSPRFKPTKAVIVPPRQNARVRSKLRTRLPPVKNTAEEESARKPARRGRPPKNAAQPPAPKKTTGRKAVDAAVTKPTKPTKPLAPRKMRGHTVRQIPDKYVARVDQFLHELMEADSSDAAPVEDEQDNMEPTSAGADDQGDEYGLDSSGQDREEYQDAGEYSDGAGIDADGQQDDAQDGYEDEDGAVVAPSDQLEDHDQELSDDFDENMSGQSDGPLQEVQPDMSMQETVLMEQDSEPGHVAYQEEVHMEIAVETNGPEDAQALLSGEDKENFVQENSRPSVSLFG